MARSAEIKAKINAKEAERAELLSHHSNVNSVINETSCLQNLLGSAGAAMKEVGSIGGIPFDEGKTEKFATGLSKITANLELDSKQILAKISAIEEQIEHLWTEYYAALEREEAARKAAREAARLARLKKTM